MRGEVLRVKAPKTRSSLPYVVVRWENGHTGRMTITLLVRVQPVTTTCPQCDGWGTSGRMVSGVGFAVHAQGSCPACGGTGVVT